MSQENIIKLECKDCKRAGYNSHKNKKTLKERLELSKFCKWCNKHVMHKETK
ncbi:MAG: 50S ribosomal protein L33 [Candidatus Uhrbacteria bacterium]|nr:50S ribosomal protein L33 [Candidatus Uhrbacteria bacterium]